MSVNLASGLGLLFLALDYLDGFLARRFQERTRFGQNLDTFTDRLAFLLAFLAAGITGLIPDRVFFSLLALFALQTIPAAVFWLRPLPRTWNICNKLSGISLLLGWLIRGAFGAACYDLAILFALLHLLRDNLDLLRKSNIWGLTPNVRLRDLILRRGEIKMNGSW